MRTRNKSFKEINEKYNIEINRITKTITKERAKRVLLQFPEGMKPYSKAICDEIEKKTNCECFIWLDSCFGACDLPIEVEKLGVNLIIQFGHSSWRYPKKKGIKVI